jgi:cytochrome c peroxidase
MDMHDAARSLLASLAVAAASALAQTADPPAPPSLATVAVPRPANLAQFVADEAAALRLGKALFWDMQIGSDGRVACATCHFHAGADSRSINQVNPGLRRRDSSGAQAPDRTFGVPPNSHLAKAHFPLRVLSDPTIRGSSAVRDSNDVVGSQGVFNTAFVSGAPNGTSSGEETVLRLPDPDGFSVGGLNVRRVESRHTPSVINAVFNHRNFWDGRAQNEFNGVNEWGDRDPDARVLRAVGKDAVEWVRVRLVDASLASQAVAPIVNPTELSAASRTTADVGRKLGKKVGKLRPLGAQLVHPDDSVLGADSRWPKPGLDLASYEDLIRKAFVGVWHDSKVVITVAGDGSVGVRGKRKPAPDAAEYTLMQYNFALFFGIAIQLYESTLVSDDTPYDRWREGRGALSPEALVGLEVFLGQQARTTSSTPRRAGGRCINCHAGPEFTDASVASIAAFGETRNREGQDLDRGYNNIGVRGTPDDAGIGASDAFGVPLSVTRVRPKSTRYVAVDGAFKAPGLRNVELTAPYFHNGGYDTLEGVVDFYGRGGDFAPLRGFDGTEIRPLSVPEFSDEDRTGLLAFLRALTDERVRFRRAPFDHPQLFVPDGQLFDEFASSADPTRSGQALDRMREIPAVGRDGGAPLPPFLGP